MTQFTQTNSGTIQSLCDTRLTPVTVYFRILFQGILIGICGCLVISLTIFVMWQVNASSSSGVPVPGPGAVEPEHEETELPPNGLVTEQTSTDLVDSLAPLLPPPIPED